MITSVTGVNTLNGISIGSGAWSPRSGEMLMVCAFCYLGLPVQHRLAEEAYMFCCCAFFPYFLPELIDENRLIRRPPLLHQQWSPQFYSWNIQRHLTHTAPLFYRGAKRPKFWPQSSSNRRIFELRRFIGKQKQTCQGPMIGLPPHQMWGGWILPTPRTVGAIGTPKGKSGKFLIYPPFQQPTPSTAPPMLYHLLGP